MGRPLKPFLELSRSQQRRRIRSCLQVDIDSIYLTNAGNNIASSPTRPLCSPPIPCAFINNDICHENDYFFEHFGDAESLHSLINERSTDTVINCAVRILCDIKECVCNNKYAQDLMTYFVDNMELLYGEETLMYNIHNFIHISADVLNYGPLDSFSCFPFKSFLQKIKLMIKGGAQPLAQIMKRITE